MRAIAGMVVALMLSGGAGVAGGGMAGRLARVNMQQTGSMPQQPDTMPQQPGADPMQGLHGDSDAEAGIDNNMRKRMQEQAIQRANIDRHKKMEADVDKLIQLSAELKADVDKTSNDQMSVQAIQKAGEIEKLAHDVKERMKG